jgi:sugar phosphate isomerase/epimerase
MRISCASVLFPELDDLGNIAARVGAAGYDGIDWRVQTDYHVPPAQLAERAQDIREICAGEGLEIPTLRTYADPTDVGFLEVAREAALEMGCASVRIGGFGYDGSVDFADVYASAVTQLRGVEQVFGGSGVRALIEVHFGTIHASAAGTRALLEHVDPSAVGVIADPSNMVVEGREDWRMAFDMLAPYLQVVDVRNSRWAPAPGGGWDWEWAPLAEGMAPWPELVALLAGRGFDGWLTNENIFQVPTSSTGYIGERHDSLGGYEGERTIDERLADIEYLRSLQAESVR